MSNQQFIHYDRVKTAIEYIRANFRQQPSLQEIADQVHISPYHFQRLFSEWAGVSPKTFLQYISIEYAKNLIRQRKATISETAYETGLSGTGRLHDLFISIEGMTPGEFKNQGENLSINFSFADSPFGEILVASTLKGICFMAFADDREKVFAQLKATFPNAKLTQTVDLVQQNALYIFTHDWTKLEKIKLHLKGSEFQLKVWQALLKIPFGKLDTYGSVAERIDRPKASRAVGSAIGSNPVAFLIPCHRVIQSSGAIGDYMWGQVRKTAIIGWEAAKVNYNR
jgi:AraC family transcriptional regulator, regulatory protein of adaptative response / methylated-DNA-[protein]-cysteine methyltransferase